MGHKIRTRKIKRDPRFTTTNVKGRKAVPTFKARDPEAKAKGDRRREAKAERHASRVAAWQGAPAPAAAAAPPAEAAGAAGAEDGAVVHPMSKAALAAQPRKPKKPNRGGKERRRRHRDKVANTKEPWAPTPRGDLAHWLRLARAGGVPVKSRNEMPQVQELGPMMRRFHKRTQPRPNAYNGQGLARASVFLELRTEDFMPQFKA